MAKASSKLEINQATHEELAALPGIGPSTAEALIKLRDQRGGFKSVDELEEVQGVGVQTLKNIRGHVSVSTKAENGRGGNGGEAAGRAAEKTASAARETGETAVGAAAETARAETEALHRTVTSLTEAARRTLDAAGGKSEEFGRAADDARQDVLGSVREVNEMWLGLVQTQIQANVETAQRLMHCRTPKDLANVQSEYVRSSMERMVDGTTRAVAAGSQLAQTMWRPFQTVTRR